MTGNDDNSETAVPHPAATAEAPEGVANNGDASDDHGKDNSEPAVNDEVDVNGLGTPTLEPPD